MALNQIVLMGCKTQSQRNSRHSLYMFSIVLFLYANIVYWYESLNKTIELYNDMYLQCIFGLDAIADKYHLSKDVHGNECMFA